VGSGFFIHGDTADFILNDAAQVSRRLSLAQIQRRGLIFNR
jgi:hypothetical protein